MLLQVLAGHDPQWPRSTDVAVPNYLELMAGAKMRPRVGIPRANFFESLDDEVRQTVESALNVLRSLSSDVREVAFPLGYSTLVDQFVELMAEVYAYHAPLLERHGALYHPSTRKILSTFSHIVARHAMEQERLEIRGLFDEVDFLVMPTAKRTAPPTDYRPEAANLEGFDYRNTVLPAVYNTWAFNFLGLPAISVPCGFTSKGLPVGLQIVGGPFAETKLLAFAHAYELATSWHRRTPKL